MTSDENQCLEQKAASTLKHFKMINPGERIVVAVSGGPDSTALLHLLYSLSKQMGFSIHAAHLNHQFRGAEAEADARAVHDFCKTLNIPVTLGSIDVPAYLRETGKSTQDGAREVRYQFLNEVADKTGASKIAVGHNADDQVETVLIHLMRGSGLDGLRGIPPIRGRIIRPFIESWRKDIVDYCHRHKLATRLDSSNLKPVYLRNRIRLNLVPLLEENYNSDIKAVILRMSELLRDDGEFIQSHADTVSHQILHKISPESVEINRSQLSEQSPAIARRVIRDGISQVKGDLDQIGFEVVDEILKRSSEPGCFKINLPGNLFAEATSASLIISLPKQVIPAVTISQDLKVPGLTKVSEFGMTFDASLKEGLSENGLNQGPWNAVLDWNQIKPPIKIRNRKTGDRFIPLGMTQSKKLQDFFVDKKIPHDQRDQILLVEDQEKIIWIPGFTISESVKVTETTSCFLYITAINSLKLPDDL